MAEPVNLDSFRQKPTRPLETSGDGGDSTGMDWQPAINRVDDKVESNFKWTVGIFGGGFMALLAAFASAFFKFIRAA